MMMLLSAEQAIKSNQSNGEAEWKESYASKESMLTLEENFLTLNTSFWWYTLNIYRVTLWHMCKTTTHFL